MSEELSYTLPHDISNAVVLPKKNKSDNKSQNSSDGSKRDARGRFVVSSASRKAHTRKQQKRLDKLKDRRRKQQNREDLLERLQQYQIGVDEVNKLVSVAHINRKGKRRGEQSVTAKVPSSIKGSNKRSKNLKHPVDEMKLDDSSSDDSSDDDDDDADYNEECGQKASKADEMCDSKGVNGEEQMTSDKVLVAEETVLHADLGGHIVESKDGDADIGISDAEPYVPKVIHVPVERPMELDEQRRQLPIIGSEQEIVESVKTNPVSIICGETGSGKTTQVPQFLYEAGFSRGLLSSSDLLFPDDENKTSSANKQIIGITEPRRVAAVSMAGRVGQEMGLSASVVSYQIRYEKTVTSDTEIKFMTDGILLREVQSDFLLKRYSVIIIDEAHERSMYSDILIGLLSRIIRIRAKKTETPLRLIIMSATLRVDDFTGEHLFRKKPTVINVESRQFPVTTYFNRVTHEDYMTEGYKKVCKVHRLLPPGAILVFVSGQQEIYSLITKLQKTFPFRDSRSTSNAKPSTETLPKSKRKQKTTPTASGRIDPVPPKKRRHRPEASSLAKSDQQIYLSDYDVNDLFAPDVDKAVDLNEADATEMDLFSDSEVEEVEGDGRFKGDADDQGDEAQPLYCLPLYSLLPTREQARVFESPPEGSRLCVVATNVAETSLTIPGVKYVVDTGKAKSRVYSASTGVSQFSIHWISQASANQRAGRAGRTGPGHCYRLYSSAVFADFDKHPFPEISQKPVDELVLQMKKLMILKVVNFPFPTPPERANLEAAEERLIRLGALRRSQAKVINDKPQLKDVAPARITQIGKAIANLPVVPQYGKMIVLAIKQNILPYVVQLIAALSVRELLLKPNDRPKDVPASVEALKLSRQRHAWLRCRRLWCRSSSGDVHPCGDFLLLLKAIGSTEYALSQSASSLKALCDEAGVRLKAVTEACKLKHQLRSLISLALANDVVANGATSSDHDLLLCGSADLPPPTDAQVTQLQAVILAGLAENVARRTDKDGDGNALKGAYQCSNGLKQAVFIHPTSVLHRKMPEWVVYHEIIETTGKKPKKYMHLIMEIEPSWLTSWAPSHCSFGAPLNDPAPFYDPSRDEVLCSTSATFGVAAWMLPSPFIQHPLDLQHYRIFVAAFLAGEVFPRLGSLRGKLLASPSVMLKPWAKLQKRTESLLSAIVSKDIRSRESLKTIWRDRKDFLCEEYCQWLPQSLHSELQLMWPPVFDQ